MSLDCVEIYNPSLDYLGISAEIVSINTCEAPKSIFVLSQRDIKTSSIMLTLPDILLPYQERLRRLQENLAEDGLSINEASYDAFRSFIRASSALPKARLFALDNGNLRAVWKGSQGAHVALEFIDRTNVRFVTFLPDVDDSIARETGKLSHDRALSKIFDSDVIALLENS